MKSFLVVFLGIVLVNCNVISQFPINYNSNRSIMQVMLEVENKIKAGDALDTVNGVLNGFKSAVNSEQIDHDTVYAKQKSECDSELAYRTKEITDATVTIRESTQVINKATKIKNKAAAMNVMVSAGLQAWTSTGSDDQKGLEKVKFTTWSNAVLNFNNAINAVDDAVDIAKELAAGRGSFAQIKDLSVSFLQHAVKTNQFIKFKPLMASFVALTQSEDNSALYEELIQSLAEVRANLEEALAELQKDRVEFEAKIINSNDIFARGITRYTKYNNDLNDKIEKSDSTIATQTGVQQAAVNKLQRNKILFDDATVLCGSFDKEYSATTQGRRQSLTLVGELERLVQKRLEQKAEQ